MTTATPSTADRVSLWDRITEANDADAGHVVQITSLPVPGRPGAIDYSAVCLDGCGLIDRAAMLPRLVARVSDHGTVVDHSRHGYHNQSRLIGFGF